MCGIAGMFCPDPSGEEVSLWSVERMLGAIVHRGPDDSGSWLDADAGVALGHRRLSILDLSAAGHQPMLSQSGRYVIVFNGEIYNHLALRHELENAGVASGWRGHSDTETLLAGFEAWGIRATIEKAIGMFAFAVWCRNDRTLTLGRDRLGEKPLYYGWQGEGREAVFFFASELKACRAHPRFDGQVNRQALASFMRHNAIGGVQSIYSGIHKLLPGCLLTLSARNRTPIASPYWQAADVARAGIEQPFSGSPEEAVDALEILLKDAIAQQMVADVPLGAFLSGGVDSSTIVALMQEQSDRPIKTFSIGFHEEGYDEAQYARAVAKHLGTEHTELYVTAEQAMDVVPLLPTLFDEPFADSSQIPTFLVSRLARQHVAVSLSGDAGDELFCGYNRYRITASLWHKLAKIPRPLRASVACAIRTLSPAAWNRTVHTLGGFPALGRVFRQWANPGDKLHKGSFVMASETAEALYKSLISHWSDPAQIVIGGSEATDPRFTDIFFPNGLNDIERMMLQDLLAYLPDDILTKVDRAAMAVSLETRVPFLDHRVVEFAWKLPLAYKLRGKETKWALRQVLYRRVPKALIERPKMGFGVPIDSWLRGPLREWAEALLDESRLRREGYFHPEPIREKWTEHLSGQRNWQYHLWDVLMFQSWLEANQA